MTILAYRRNPVKPQDMVTHAFKRFGDTGHVMPPRQRAIYEGLSRIVEGRSILEAGCGIGVGTDILRGRPFIYKAQEAVHRIVIGTDYDSKHLAFAVEMHPHCTFDLWDIIQGPYPAKLYDWVVAVEVLEHLEDPDTALRNLVLSAKETVWISTPNRNSPEISNDQPNNPHHVQEFTPHEVIDMALPYVSAVKLWHWKDFRFMDPDTDVTPLVYELIL